ncbi:MAG: single-stranded DNA-binding protein [Abditibacteriales bacterium]|nr:single-stranded DNA-binding protein [Abditibacteriales bacterium]MDW8365442.1 single-stranded DNA-binding protein [Abditibacteriales bacterium]
MMNRVTLIGRLTADPELRYTLNGKAVAHFTLAVDRRFKNAQGERETDFIRIVAWEKSAEFAANYLTKGRLAGVDGRLQTRTYETPQGERRTIAEVVAEVVQALDRPQESPLPESTPAAEMLSSVESPSASSELDDTDPFAQPPVSATAAKAVNVASVERGTPANVRTAPQRRAARAA